MEIDYINFYIDTHSSEAREYVYTMVHIHNADDVDPRYYMKIIQSNKEPVCESTYFHIKGSWDAYNLFLNTAQEYSYSISHFNE